MKAAALYMYTRQTRFLYTGGNNTCKTEQKTAEKNEKKHKKTKEDKTRKRTNRKQKIEQKAKRTLRNKESGSCATPNTNLPWTAKLMAVEKSKKYKK